MKCVMMGMIFLMMVVLNVKLNVKKLVLFVMMDNALNAHLAGF